MAAGPYKEENHPESAPGDFYVINEGCMSCGAPHALAPDLIGWAPVDENHCTWKKQPETPEELEQAIAAFDASCCDNYRYAGADPEIIARLPPICCDQVKQPVWRKLVDAVVVKAFLALMWLTLPHRKPPAD